MEIQSSKEENWSLVIRPQRALLYARDSLKVYGDFRSKARALVLELKQKGITRVSIDGKNVMMDILRLTCIEAGLVISDLPEGCVLESDGRGYRVLNLK